MRIIPGPGVVIVGQVDYHGFPLLHHRQRRVGRWFSPLANECVDTGYYRRVHEASTLHLRIRDRNLGEVGGVV